MRELTGPGPSGKKEYEMAVRVSGKHMDVGEAFRTRIEERMNEAVDKYFDGNFSASSVVAKDGSRFSCDCVIHLDTGVVFQAQGQAHDPEASFMEAAEKLEKRLRRYKRRLKDHHANGGGHKALAYQVMEAIPEEVEEIPEDYAPAIIAETTLKVGTLSVAGAVMELDRILLLFFISERFHLLPAERLPEAGGHGGGHGVGCLGFTVQRLLCLRVASHLECDRPLRQAPRG